MSEGFFGETLAPGDLDDYDKLLSRTRTVAAEMQAAGRVLSRIGLDDVWRGEAASAYARMIGTLPRMVDGAGDAFAGVVAAMAAQRTWLADAKERARTLERQGVELQRAVQVADSQAYALGTTALGAPDPVLQAARVAAAQQAAADLRSDLERLYGQARALRQECREQGSRTARRVRDCFGRPPKDPYPNWWDKMGKALGDGDLWTAATAPAHALFENYPTLMEDLSGVLSDVSTWTAYAGLALFWVPGVGAGLTVISIATGAGALVIDGAQWAVGTVDADGLQAVTGAEVVEGALGVALSAGGAAAGAAVKAARPAAGAATSFGSRYTDELAAYLPTRWASSLGTVWTRAPHLGTFAGTALTDVLSNGADVAVFAGVTVFTLPPTVGVLAGTRPSAFAPDTPTADPSVPVRARAADLRDLADEWAAPLRPAPPPRGQQP